MEKSLTKIAKMQNEVKVTNKEHMGVIKEFEDEQKKISIQV